MLALICYKCWHSLSISANIIPPLFLLVKRLMKDFLLFLYKFWNKFCAFSGAFARARAFPHIFARAQPPFSAPAPSPHIFARAQPPFSAPFSAPAPSPTFFPRSAAVLRAFLRACLLPCPFLRGMQHRLRRMLHDLFGRFVEVVSDPLVDHAEKPVHEKGA